ncbi:MAG TPA: hypothetical protein VHZ78_15250 [Rhizomicrobium sp.]|jgi:hypothetical protein|nr:hypothetical protein [Rhizomicrobium sp.]
MDIELNFINRSNDANNSDVVIFQKNVATDFNEIAVAWKVIRNCGQGFNHPFVYPMTMSAAASDAWGNHTPQMEALNGQRFAMTPTPSGNRLSFSGTSTSPNEVQVANELLQGSINAGIYRAGKPIAMKTSLTPGQTATFSFKPTLWIGVTSEADEGRAMHSAVMSSINTELSLLGIASADIVMTGGGPGPDSTPFQFTLANIVFA